MSIYVDIEKKLGDFQLKVAFEAGDETLALLGDSGCGKSMTLRCIAGITRPDKGVIRINGETVFDAAQRIDQKPQKRRVGYLFQNYALFPNLTVEGNILAGLERHRGVSRAQRKEEAAAYLARFHLEELADHYPSQLSGGQQQRTALARMLASKPDLLLLDEPFSALDATLRWEMEQVVRETIRSFQGTALVVTHDRDEVYRLSDRVAVYNRGKIDALGEKWALFAHPATVTTARLTGCKNLAPARVEGDRIVVERWQLSFPLHTPGNWNWVGIRAHRFQLCQAETEYGFAFEVVNRIEDTFSYILQIRRRGTQGETLRWEVDKSQGISVPDTGFVRIPPDEILLLQ
jgi:molybdate transport system ATP-binding protein